MDSNEIFINEFRNETVTEIHCNVAQMMQVIRKE